MSTGRVRARTTTRSRYVSDRRATWCPDGSRSPRGAARIGLSSKAQVPERPTIPLYELGMCRRDAREDVLWAETLTRWAATWAPRTGRIQPHRVRDSSPAVAQHQQYLAQLHGGSMLQNLGRPGHGPKPKPAPRADRGRADGGGKKSGIGNAGCVTAGVVGSEDERNLAAQVKLSAPACALLVNEGDPRSEGA